MDIGRMGSGARPKLKQAATVKTTVKITQVWLLIIIIRHERLLIDKNDNQCTDLPTLTDVTWNNSQNHVTEKIKSNEINF